MGSPLTADKLQQLHCLFLQHDQRGDSKIALSQLGDCLRVVGANPSEEIIRQQIQKLHERGTERISFDEFLAIYEHVQSEEVASPAGIASIAEEFISCFRFFDEKNTGFISANRLRHILVNCGESLTMEEVDQILADRINDQGMVNYAELVNIILNS